MPCNPASYHVGPDQVRNRRYENAGRVQKELGPPDFAIAVAARPRTGDSFTAHDWWNMRSMQPIQQVAALGENLREVDRHRNMTSLAAFIGVQPTEG